jgi:hypothetical protein
MAVATSKNNCHVLVAVYFHIDDCRMSCYIVNVHQFSDRYLFNRHIEAVCRILYRLLDPFFAIRKMRVIRAALAFVSPYPRAGLSKSRLPLWVCRSVSAASRRSSRRPSRRKVAIMIIRLITENRAPSATLTAQQYLLQQAAEAHKRGNGGTE